MTFDPTIQLRPAEPADAAAIRDIVRAAYARWVPVIGREPLPMRADYDKAVREHQFDLAVAPYAQGKGIGRLLLDRAERRAVEAGCPELRLLTNGAFETNVLLYRKH